MDLTNFSKDLKKNEKNEKTQKEDLSFNNNSNLEVNFSDLKNNFKKEDINYFLPWFLKYKIKSFDEIIKTEEVKTMLNYIEKKDFSKAVLVYGHAGSGKTTTINFLSNHFDLELVELNASDTRSKKTINEIINDLIKQKSFFSKNKLILLDEIDGISGHHDRGGVLEIISIILKKKCPIFLTANNVDNDKLKSLKKYCIKVDFDKHMTSVLERISKNILQNEKIEYNKEDIDFFIKNSHSKDIRGFINDLQKNCIKNKFELDKNFEIRDYKKKIENFLNLIFYSYPEDSLKNSIFFELNLDDLMLYLEENLYKVYDYKDFRKAFLEVSKADLYKGRIRKWQYWRFLVYVNFYLTYGVSSHKNLPKKISEYSKNQKILKKWIYTNSFSFLNPRTKIQKEKEEDLKFIEKLSNVYKTSAKKTRSKILPYFVFMYKNNLEFQKYYDTKLEICEKTKNQLLKYS